MLCRAKVNLTLHVGAPLAEGRWRGYHPVESLVVFADFGDRLTFEPAQETSLTIDGPFGEGLSAQPDNLVLKALEACGALPMAATLTKNLPVSAGLGGGSANAAGVLRAFDPSESVDAVGLGADVPVCRLSRTAMMEGIGERVSEVPGLGQLAAVLVNPRVPVSTAKIFQDYDTHQPPVSPRQTSRTGTLTERALSGRNDLQDAASAQAPVIAKVLSALQAQPGCDLARMSGSGATCFGLFRSDVAARQAAEALDGTGWWVKACRLGDVD